MRGGKVPGLVIALWALAASLVVLAAALSNAAGPAVH
jgi:hypothetical protein